MSTTHFGFRNVQTSEKASLVKDVFDRVSPRYDLMNDLMSFGLHRLWKRELVSALRPRAGANYLDLAGGTGDIAFRVSDTMDVGNITICDINASMLNEGRNRAIDQNRLNGLDWVCGNAESLPFGDMQFDGATIAFGIRNVTDIPRALCEIHRVLKPGGHFLCLEFSQVTQPQLAKLYQEYSFRVIPRIGKAVIGDGEPYQYLVESIRQFPNQEKFATMLREAGFARVSYRNLTHGVVAIHSGWRV